MHYNPIGNIVKLMKALTTTSYALLGLLALRPWTTYELAQQMERSLSNFWPRAQSKIYEEPKNLVAHGLATAERERIGRRPRTVYSITEEGRQALRSWLDEPGAPRSMEWEALLKVFFADQGTKEQMLAQIRTIKARAEASHEQGRGFLREYADTGGPFPERLNIIGIMVSLLVGIDDAVLSWARWAEAEVSAWDDVHQPGDREIFRRLLERSERDVAGD